MKNKFIAKIIEDECIGCTQCIKVCPVDAILGSAKLMHTVIENECIGCELCLPPCPVDCIELKPMTHTTDPTHTKQRVINRKDRIRQLSASTPLNSGNDKPKDYIANLIKRNKKKI